jgi:hypothetical protein
MARSLPLHRQYGACLVGVGGRDLDAKGRGPRNNFAHAIGSWFAKESAP